MTGTQIAQIGQMGKRRGGMRICALPFAKPNLRSPPNLRALETRPSSYAMRSRRKSSVTRSRKRTKSKAST